MPELFTPTDGINREGQDALLGAPTYIGQAHFAGTGPEGRTCRECKAWMAKGTWRKDKGFGNVPEPVHSGCRKFRSFTNKHRAPAFPHDALACKHFEENPTPQALAPPPKKWES